MAQISAVISTTDQTFRTNVARLLRSSGLSVAVTDERHVAAGSAPDLAIVDVRRASAAAQGALERLRAAWPSAAIFVIASSSEPDQILQAMRAGANEFLAWPLREDEPVSLEEPFQAALARTAERIRASRAGARRSCATLTFFGAKGGAGTTTLAVNSAIEIARLSRRPTLIVDLHQFVGEVSLFLGLRPRFTLIDALDNLHRLDAEFLREVVARHKSGLEVLAGAEQVDRPGPADAPALEQLLQVLGRNYEFIVIDAGTLTQPCADVAVYAADAVYVVANPDVPSIRNTQRVVDRITQLGADRDRIRVLLNRTSEQHVIGPKQLESALGHVILQTFPSDYHSVSAALNSGVPLALSNHSPLAAEFGRFIRSIVRIPPDASKSGGDKRRGTFLGLF